MPGLRFYSPEISVEEKRILAKELTKEVVSSLNLPTELSNWTFIHFVTYKLEEFAIGGNLVLDTQGPWYFLEITERNWDIEKKQTVVRNITLLLSKLLKLKSEEIYKINIILLEYKPEDMARAGKLLSQSS
ncbi:MAG: hypothetical protein JOZ78_10010 [Chroococcidiopsidaceae cyanobacterium CP_BM_ER_R8_30]|nr:hypothetical protein [Chroococcidiopsidaceae cyanobacterium CP_BM_ER_R8_30]